MKPLKPVVRAIAKGDIPAVIALMREFAAYEQLADYCTITPERLGAAMFDPGAFVEGLIALEGVTPIAYALFYPAFSSFRGERGLYLEDIFVSTNKRGLNVGELMLREIARIAQSRGLERIDFLVLDWNASAIGFYKKHGAEACDDETHFKFSGQALDRLAG
jgi:ribosomal protein S18 acetylase RimI-like enzyme